MNTFIWLILSAVICFSRQGNAGLEPGLPTSRHYSVRVKHAPNTEWTPLLTWETACKAVEKGTDGYFESLAGWTHAYANFELTVEVEVEISRRDGEPIRTAAVHPRRKAVSCHVKDGKAYVRLDKPCLVAVDINGQMDTRDTGKGYKGPPIHTISLFANPPLSGKPTPDLPGVLAVKPGEKPPDDGPWHTLYFLPGVHDIGIGFPVRGRRSYYIAEDAIVYGTFSNRTWGDGKGIRIFGHGTLSGARITHPKFAKPCASETDHGLRRPIEIMGATDTTVEGITIADSATHSLMLIHPYQEENPNKVAWTKIFTWRVNGDGINPFGNTLVEDCFIRTQDDSLYVNGRGIRRTVIWNDANGSSFVLSALDNLGDRGIVVEDCDVIYSRAHWHHWSGGRVFNMRGEGKGAAGENVVFRNINIEDPRPTLQQFFLCMGVPPPYSKDKQERGPGDLSGIHFDNLAIAAPSVLNEPQILHGLPDARIGTLTIRNLTVGGKPVTDPRFFQSNEFANAPEFLASDP
jgi:hypothetical protein